MERQLSDISTVELKALAYDQLAQLEMIQNNLRTLNQELSRRANPQSQFPNQPGTGQIEPLPQGSIQTV